MLLGATLYAKTLATLVSFYQRLGLSVVSETEDFAALMSGSNELIIVQAPPAIADAIELSEPPEARTQTPIKLTFVVDSIEDIVASLSALGARTDRGQARWQFGDYHVQDGVDPEGNIFQLRELIKN